MPHYQPRIFVVHGFYNRNFVGVSDLVVKRKLILQLKPPKVEGPLDDNLPLPQERLQRARHDLGFKHEL